ncbi:hypothetical protein EBB07_21460 [Paenibacillaceae bacterium]|nr:hypothetical protein EBB07_21460 [Paenibacillaceae bacterium]
MIVYMTVKSAGKRTGYLRRMAWPLTSKPATLRDFIADVVQTSVRQFNNKELETPLVPYLTQTEISEQGEAGKVGFGTLYHEGKADARQAVETAITAFEDGLYKVFINETELTSLDEPLEIKDQDEVALIRFTMLAGRLW